MVEGCGGHPTLDSRLPGCEFMVCDCVVEATELPVPSSMATVGMVLVSDRWGTVQDRIEILMTPRLQELRLKELVKGLDAIKRHIQAGNLGTACERLYATYSELRVISRRRKT